ncbi:MAG: DsbC/DsbD-like thiol-disulfide interchange protein [Nitrospinales bacterium]|jgi:DsbC/DsbD-like thiol-disulfide interchange protein
MKRVLIILILIFLFPLALFANPPFDRSQASLPQIKINVLTNKSVVFPGEKFKFYMSVLIEEGWHIYSLSPLKGSELLATQILIDENVFQEQEGWREPEPVLIHDEAVGEMVKGHKGNVEFSRNYNVPVDVETGKYLLKGRLLYRACDNQICTLPQEFPFNADLQVSRK